MKKCLIVLLTVILTALLFINCPLLSKYNSSSDDSDDELSSYNDPTTQSGYTTTIAGRDNHLIRKIVIPTKEVKTLAGSAGITGFTDGNGSDARFYWPSGIISVNGTYIYAADSYNNTIRKIVK